MQKLKKYRIGYTQGVYDMFHIGHLNLINNAKALCDYLIVGVNSDDLVQQYKNKRPIIDEESRRTIVGNIKAVDLAIITRTLDKLEILEHYHYNVIFIGDDWKNNSRWIRTGEVLAKKGVDLVYLPYTESVCSTQLRDKKSDAIKDEDMN